MGKAPRGFFVDGFPTRVAREGKAVFAMWGKMKESDFCNVKESGFRNVGESFSAMLPEPCPAGDPPAPIPPIALPRPPRRPETLEEIQDNRFGRRISRPKAPKADFSQDLRGNFGKKRILCLTLSSRIR